MTKVAEDYRSAPERSSHPLLAPQGSDFSRWWEQEPNKTLAGLGPFAENETIEDGSDILERYLADEAADDDDEGNEPTRLLTRSLLQLAPGIGAEPAAVAGPKNAPEPAARAALDACALDELARRVNHDSVLRKWMTNSSPEAAAPSLLVQSKVAQPRAQPSVPSVSSAATSRTLEPLVATLRRRANQLPLPRVRLSAALAGAAVAAVLLLFGLSRLGGAQASAEQVASGPASRTLVQPQALPPAPVATFITLRSGVGAEGAVVELIGDGHLRRVEHLPARIPANRSETYRVHARRAGYRDFSTELAFGNGEADIAVLIELQPEQVLPALHSPLVAAAPLPLPKPAGLPLVAAMPAVRANSAGETLVRVKADAKPLAAGSAGLSLNSIPLSTVIVDGRSQGLTPRVLQVTPGVHTVVFVHPELGRRLVSVDVTGGTTAVAAVKF